MDSKKAESMQPQQLAIPATTADVTSDYCMNKRDIAFLDAFFNSDGNSDIIDDLFASLNTNIKTGNTEACIEESKRVHAI